MEASLDRLRRDEVENELIGIFKRTLDAHYPEESGVTREEYLSTFEQILRREIPEAPVLDVATGTLATYAKLSVLGLTMAKHLETYGLSEDQIGERIYRTADAYFRLSAVRRWIQRTLFFSIVNIRQIKGREEATSRSANGVNGFKLRYVEGTTPDEFGVDYLACGICTYYTRRGMFGYVKYLCLVDYAIMKNMGIAFSRTTTLGNNGPKCDFRFSKAGTIVEGWPPSWLVESQPAGALGSSTTCPEQRGSGVEQSEARERGS
jgi:hypothetical protein